MITDKTKPHCADTTDTDIDSLEQLGLDSCGD